MKIVTKSREQRNQEEAFKAGVEHTLRKLVENNVILYGVSGFGSCRKVCVDLGKADQVDALVYEVIWGQSSTGGDTQFI